MIFLQEEKTASHTIVHLDPRQLDD